MNVLLYMKKETKIICPKFQNTKSKNEIFYKKLHSDSLREKFILYLPNKSAK
jgi:hypothetical protein